MTTMTPDQERLIRQLNSLIAEGLPDRSAFIDVPGVLIEWRTFPKAEWNMVAIRQPFTQQQIPKNNLLVFATWPATEAILRYLEEPPQVVDQMQLEAARNIRFALEAIGVDSDIALHQGFELVANFADEPFGVGSDWHNEYLKAAAALNEEVPPT